MKKFISIILLLAVPVMVFAGIVGEWTAYPSFYNLTEVEEGNNKVFFLASKALYSYNKNDDSVETYDKTKSLTDCNITHIAWCQAAKRLVITYENQNIDIIDEQGNVYNMPDFYNKPMTVDKTINAINVYDKYAYISTAFGIVKVNVSTLEFTDSYILGINVNWTKVDQERIYAESSAAGEYSALLSSNLLDKKSWTRTAGYKSQNKTLTAEQRQMAATYMPVAPKYNDFYNLHYANERLYTAPGLYIRSLAEKNNKSTGQIWNGTDWLVFDDNMMEKTGHDAKDISIVVVDPHNPDHVFTAGASGIYEFMNGAFVNHYDCDNSPIQLHSGNHRLAIIGGMTIDKEGNLWVNNMHQILKFTTDRQWEIISTAYTDYKGLAHLYLDDYGLLWFGQHRSEPFITAYYDTRNDTFHNITKFVNEDGTDVSSAVEAFCQDKEGNIWIGTEKGPFYISRQQIGSGDDTFIQVKVPRNDGTNLADYLLADVEVCGIKIDAANRKWFCTRGLGVYVISSDCMEQEHHYVSSNSGLLSDEVYDVAFDEKSGEVYFATANGLCSLTSDVTGTTSDLNSDDIYAYPNPVTPEYEGPVTIVGLSYNAYVKIVSVSGQLVAQGRSTGGSFTWYGKDMDGKKVASGVYNVLVATEDGKKGAACKIAIVR